MTIQEREQLIIAKQISRKLAVEPGEKRSAALIQMSKCLLEGKEEILQANAADIAKAEERGAAQKRIRILTLKESDIADMAAYFQTMAAYPDPVGQILETVRKEDGLIREKRLVPLGVVSMVYEARPSVVTDGAALCMRTGNVLILRCSSLCQHTDAAICACLRKGIQMAGLPADSLILLSRPDHELTLELVKEERFVDLMIVRGGYDVLEQVKNAALVPVIGAGPGNCHIYIDDSARPEMAKAIVLNSKVPRPLACNAVETILVHQVWAKGHLVDLLSELKSAGISLRGCEKVREMDHDVKYAEEEDWKWEYFAPILAVKIVDDVEEAITHINQYRTPHTETIITENMEHANRFLAYVEANVVCHNAATRLTDGIEFGLGGEMGISTQKYPVGGPIGMEALMQKKYYLLGNGNLR